MLHLEKVNGKNIWDILKLQVSETQKSFVAANDISIIEAYITITANGYAVHDYWIDAPKIAKGNYNLWRLMIDKAYQNNGFGKEVVKLALDFVKTFPCGKAECCWLSYEPENQVARKLYSSFGFVETGDTDGEELIAVLKL